MMPRIECFDNKIKAPIKTFLASCLDAKAFQNFLEKFSARNLGNIWNS